MGRTEAVKKVAEIMKEATMCTLTTIAEDGKLVARPMTIQEVEFDGDIWFFTYEQSNKISQIQHNPQVNVAFEAKNSWVSLSGKGEIVYDRAKAEELWSAPLKAWFPGGVDEPGLTLIKIHAETAEYWDSSNNKLVSLFGMAKAAVTGKRAEGGENKTVEL